MSDVLVAPGASTAPLGAPLLELRDVHAGYGQFRALFGVSLTVRAGQATALIGSNGAGKTTLARVATGLIHPTSGSIHFDGQDVTKKSSHQLARLGITHVTEGRSVFSSLTVEENLILSFREALGSKGVSGGLEQAYGLFPRMGERRKQSAGSLSGGEQRMLSLARALVLKPKLLIADELSLGLAPIITSEVYRVLGQILQMGTALLVVEQHVDHALDICHEVVGFERGTVGFVGTPDEVRASGYFNQAH